MDIKKILLITLIAVAIIASVSAVSAGLFDGLFGEEQKDNVIEIDDISFNTTNGTDFKENKSFSKESSDEYLKSRGYRSDNGTGDYYVLIMDYSKYGSMEDIDEQVGEGIREGFKNMPYEIINGVVVYTGSKVSSIDVGKPVHVAYVQNDDVHKIIMFGSSDQNETAKMALSLNFE